MISCVQTAGEIKSVPDPNSLPGPRRCHEVRWRGFSNLQRPSRAVCSRSFAAACIRCNIGQDGEDIIVSRRGISGSRRQVLLVPAIAVGVNCFLSFVAARAEEQPPVAAVTSSALEEDKTESKEENEKVEKEPEMPYRIYDATAIGEPQALGKDKSKVWEKLMGARIVYLGEAEQVPDKDDRILELEIVKNLRNRCLEQQRPVSVALEAFPSDTQEQLDLFMEKRIDGEGLRAFTSHWPPQQWQEYAPLLNYCRDNGIRLVACGTPLEVLRTVQAEGIRGLSKPQRKLFAPPAGSGFISGVSSIPGRSSTDAISSNQFIPFDPSSYLSAQSKVVDDYSMSQIILQSVIEGGSQGMLLVVTGASHVIYGSRGVGIPARISKKIQKKNQAVILLDPERQYIRREGEVPVADFLWYSPAKACTRNCFDRAEIARVMNAAGRRRDALPQDLQKGLDLGLVSPEILQNFFDLEKYPVISELIHRFQGFRERLLVDPKFLNRLAIEEAISITTTLLAQYERRKGRFFEEIDYVLTDTIRGSVVDFFTVWLPAPTISFLSYADNSSLPDNVGLLKNLLGSIPDNAFQKSPTGVNWGMNERVASVIFGGLKLSGVGFVSSIGAGGFSAALYLLRKTLNPSMIESPARKKASVLKQALVYGSFLGTSANLRYQIIAGLVEHRLSDYLLANYNEPMLLNLLSFVVRTINSYWGTQQWIDLARFTGLQPSKVIKETNLPPPSPPRQDGMMSRGSDSLEPTIMESSSTKATGVEEISNKSNDSQ